MERAIGGEIHVGTRAQLPPPRLAQHVYFSREQYGFVSSSSLHIEHDDVSKIHRVKWLAKKKRSDYPLRSRITSCCSSSTPASSPARTATDQSALSAISSSPMFASCRTNESSIAVA